MMNILEKQKCPLCKSELKTTEKKFLIIQDCTNCSYSLSVIKKEEATECQQ